ncbi:Nucleoid-associated protein WIGBR5260 [Planctomycetales bacterium 10988]|nr:Nucleoid-associated protein WIGBR5260 [Planctomycetales bacterium 10988]
MFKGIGQFASLMKNAQQMGGKMQEMAEELRAKRVTGTAGGDMVQIEMNGTQEILSCKIDPQLLAQGDHEMLEDLIVAAGNDAVMKARKMHEEAMASLTGGLGMGGIEGLLGSMGGKPDA